MVVFQRADLRIELIVITAETSACNLSVGDISMLNKPAVNKILTLVISDHRCRNSLIGKYFACVHNCCSFAAAKEAAH
jgi:hypothetical protein